MVEVGAAHFQSVRQVSTSFSLHGTGPKDKHMVEVRVAHFQPERRGSTSLSLYPEAHGRSESSSRSACERGFYFSLQETDFEGEHIL